MTVNAGTSPYTFALVSGSLPDGLSLNSSTGAISGTPTKDGTSTFTVSASDSGNPEQLASRELTLKINAVLPETGGNVLMRFWARLFD